jgi:fructose-bisphosphate aldolase class 1
VNRSVMEQIARVAALCQEPNSVPIVESEVPMDANHSKEPCAAVSAAIGKHDPAMESLAA